MKIRNPLVFLLGLTLLNFFQSETVQAQGFDAKEKAALAKFLPQAKVSLEKALAVSEREGLPISAGFEVDNDELNLWVFVRKGSRFLEVSVDYKNGEIDEVELISKKDDLEDANTQSQAMARAKMSLREAAETAARENPGFRVVEIVPELKDNRPVATITLNRGQEFKEITLELGLAEKRADTTGDEFIDDEIAEWDPWEPFNDKTFSFNRQVDRFVLKPVATGYNAVVPGPVRKAITNLFDNLDVTRRLVNNLLQFRFDGAGREISRFLINSSIGVAGLFDVAGSMFGIPQSNRDTGQTLGVYGIGHGPYLILPFLPPLTVRDFFGFIADEAMYPVDYFIPTAAAIGLNASEKISDRAANIDLFEGVEDTVVDLYGSVRDAYFQRRAADLKR